MPPTIHLIRHAQGEHSLPPYPEISDPSLTQVGRDQCLALRDAGVLKQENISLVTASPMIRTLQTAYLIFEPALTSIGKCAREILALPDAQEVCDYGFNTGSDLSILKERVVGEDIAVDLSRVDEGWNVKEPGSRYFPARDALRVRARDCRNQLYALARRLEEKGVENAEIVLVAHGMFLHFLTEDWEDAGRYNGSSWGHVEVRSYGFLHGEGEKVGLVETGESRVRRGKGVESLDRVEQERLYEAALEIWEEQGLHALSMTSSI
ncbi:histidine phosphatase superfamily [Aspergillus karnatakaensis]|uniref:histidine phosphatase superfamily n=1 Tax=Aspergillus karnatakaensis TaxID=1810916 RepID=UPI003CCCBACC